MAFQFNHARINSEDFIVDEKRKILVNTRSMTPSQQMLYIKNFYINPRPDLTEHDYFVFKEKWKLGEFYMNEMRKRLNGELRRMFFQTSGATRRNKVQHVQDQILQLSPPHIKGARFHADRTWEEASKIVNFIDKKLSRVSKYGLDYPIFSPHYKVDNCIQKENEVVDLLVREMKKKPFVQSTEDEE
ncbi:hypothetical protein PPERSA_06686 [Pseudocohnilembus persalinus]|uniref:Uncharacterized protein n=1 Tax=Pseudocohnilembus persalinus TaxID=266149 RepID=A0A0V0QS48_PSEPJ|nr:hypothetical protein PPERSA_06686 [Pseudocohnilembus persalinus]|eukprot:KRX05052.1 hypothetical protein PPERSA_06686 [Pseudocohnilembus persalinus]